MPLFDSILGGRKVETDKRAAARRRSQAWGDFLVRKREQLAQLNPQAGSRILHPDSTLAIPDPVHPIAPSLFTIQEEEE